MTTQPLHVANKTKFPSRGGGTPGGPHPVLACTRFNNKTWQEYQQWITTHQQTYEQMYQRPLKCIYGTPREISNKKIPAQAKILVIEMNNDENKIEGIGQIENQTASEVYRPAPLPFRKIFSDRNYSRYLYIGNTHYASREELIRNHTTDAQYINEQLITIKSSSNSTANGAAATGIKNTTTPITSQTSQEEAQIQSLERLLFKGARHMKRGSGITRCKFM